MSSAFADWIVNGLRILRSPAKWIYDGANELRRFSLLSWHARKYANAAERYAAKHRTRSLDWWRKREASVHANVVQGTPRPHVLARPTWFSLARASVSWHAGQSRLDKLNDRAELCGAVLNKSGDWATNEHAWAYNELTAIARLRDELYVAWENHELARVQPGHSKSQIATNEVNIKTSQAAAAELPAREGLLNGLVAPATPHAMSDKVGRALGSLATGAAALQHAETLAAKYPNLADDAAKDAVDDEIRLLLNDAEAALLDARGKFSSRHQLRARAATLANLVLLSLHRSTLAPDPHPARVGDSPAETELEPADEMVEAAEAIHADLIDYLERDDKASRAALLLNQGAGQVWSNPSTSGDLSPEEMYRMMKAPLVRGKWTLRRSLKLWRALQSQAASVTRGPRSPRDLKRGEGRCLLYLGDAEWRLAVLQRPGDGWPVHFTRAQSIWNEALIRCREADDFVGKAAIERRPTTSK